MPYVIKWPPAKRAGPRMARLAALGVLIVGAMSALAPSAMADTSSCAAATLTQPFLPWGDSNSYTPAPGESFDSFDGTGWTLLGDANIVSAELADGAIGNVLDLRGHSMAISPAMCVDPTYQTARAIVRRVAGRGAVSFWVARQDLDGGQWRGLDSGGMLTGHADWTLTDPVSVRADSVTGPQIVRFVFRSVGYHSDTQLYNFYVDPYAKG